MKLFLLIMLFALFVVIAIFVYLFYLFKSKLFVDLNYVCKYLKNNISFNKNNLEYLLTNCFQEINPTSRHILKNTSSPFSKLILADKKVIINDFYKSLGKGDVDFEINNLNYYLKLFDEEKEKSKEDIKQKGLLYFKLIIGIGLIVCILLI